MIFHSYVSLPEGITCFMILYQPHHVLLMFYCISDLYHSGVVAGGDFCVRNSCPTWPATAPCRKRGNVTDLVRGGCQKTWENHGKTMGPMGKSLENHGNLWHPHKWRFIVEENMELNGGFSSKPCLMTPKDI